MAHLVQTGVHGRTRRRIVAMGGLFAERFNSPSGEGLISQDKFLALLLRNDVITEQQLQRAVDSYRRCPHEYAWMLRLRHTTLDKADKIFFVRHGRFPTEDADFSVGGDYHQICRTLHYDRNCFDEELQRLAWDVAGNPRVVGAPPTVLETVQQKTSKKGNKLAFALVLLITIASAISLPLLNTVALMRGRLPLAFAMAVFWMMILACGLIVTWPRHFQANIVLHLCSECRSQLGSIQSVSHCPNCGIRFQEQVE